MIHSIFNMNKLIIASLLDKWHRLRRLPVLLLINCVQLLQERRLLLLPGFFIDLADFVGLKVERILSEPQGFLKLYGAAMKATHLGDAQFLAGF